jgi:hypothetical protein
MASLYDLFKTDDKAETQDGIVLDYGAAGQIRIVRAGGGNKRFSQALNAKLRPYQRQIANDTMDEAVAARLMAEVYAETVIIGWDGVTGPDGQPLAFCKANVVQLLTDLPDLFRDIQTQAVTAANFRAAELEEMGKNSGAASAGNSKTAKP